MLEIKDNKNYINVFDNISELVKYVTTRPRKPYRNRESEDTDPTEYSFYGTKTFDEAIDLLRYGDEQLYKSINVERKKIDIDKIIGAKNQRLKYENGLYGCVPNVPAYLKCNPMNMINPKKSKPGNKILNIFLNIRVNGGIEASDIKRIGVVYLAVIDALEKNGYRCNLYSGCANEYASKYSYMMVRIKTDKEPLNIKKICFTIAHPSMQRRIKFKWMEVNDFEQDFTNGYGHPDDASHTKAVLESKLKDKFIIWDYENGSRSKSTEQIIEDLKNKYGIKIGEN